MFILFFFYLIRAFNIDDCGAIPNDNSVLAAKINARALQCAFAKQTDGEVLVGAGARYYVLNATVEHASDVTLRIDGTLMLNDERSAWPRVSQGRLGALEFRNATRLRITGTGAVDGQGGDWWWHTILTGQDYRPIMLLVDTADGLTIDGSLRFQNSPSYHLTLRRVRNVLIEGISVYVDADAAHVPTFPLNTDGIDISGEHATIRNVSIECYDDAVAVKPLNGDDAPLTCTRNITVRDARVRFGVGMSIGSVPPHAKQNCIRDVLFDAIDFSAPLKAVYIKSNPGTVGTGLIENIVYRNISAHSAIWYPVWIGPQQQHQPDQNGTGCSFYFPFDGSQCPSQPLVTIRNVSIEDSSFTNGYLMPGVLLASSQNPYTDFRFNNVTNTGVFIGQRDYYCRNVRANLSACRCRAAASRADLVA